MEDSTPILVGVGQFTQRTAQEAKYEESLDPIAMLEKATRMAAADAGAGEALMQAADTIAVVRFIADSSETRSLTARAYPNPPRSLAKRIDAKPRTEIYTAAGGNTPQMLVSLMAERIANGEVEVAILTGAEYLASLMGGMKRGVKYEWHEDAGGEPIEIGDSRRGVNDYENAYGLSFPVNTYPLFENGLRAKAGRSVKEQMALIGKLFSPFTKLASENPGSWFPTFRTPEEIATPGEKNRFVGFPYTKYMCSVIEVDQAATVIMTSVGKARALGIPEGKWVYLHGCADATDIWNVSERINFHSSPAIRMMGQKALTMAGKTLADMTYIDLYSCFSSAVEIGAAELGLSLDDPRGLTITGGLPYFGGAGNNYVMHSIATMVEKLRAKPGAFGLLTGNGMYVTKHAIGIYSTTPTHGKWTRENPKTYQKALDAMERPRVVTEMKGEGKVETYTVVTDRKGQRFGIIVGRDAADARFLAKVEDEALIARMFEEEMLGRPVSVAHTGGLNIATFA
ncbi:MAG: acetyl-CoA acetyltransferase [Alphaproteobacteria bacterium]|nr:acetyl-CoA acetyltransferase [Alphaproteobacteria bacterium]